MSASWSAGWTGHITVTLFRYTAVVQRPKQSKSLFGWHRCFGETSSPKGVTCFRFLVSFQAMTLDGANLTTEVFYKSGHDYRFLCHGKDQTGEGCHNYRVRFLCGRSGTCPTVESQTRGKKAEILSSDGGLFFGVRATRVIPRAKTFSWAIDSNTDKTAEDLSQEKFLRQQGGGSKTRRGYGKYLAGPSL